MVCFCLYYPEEEEFSCLEFHVNVQSGTVSRTGMNIGTLLKWKRYQHFF